MKRNAVLGVVLTLTLAADLHAQDEGAAPEAPKVVKEATWDDDVVETRHRVAVEGGELAYTARAGRMKLTTQDGKSKAELFFVAYTKDDVAGSATSSFV